MSSHIDMQGFKIKWNDTSDREENIDYSGESALDLMP
jgi:hypothetical protein